MKIHARCLFHLSLSYTERTKKTGVSGQTLIEAQFINRSLSFLEQTVNALSKKESYVPYRQSKLTSMLRDALGGNCKGPDGEGESWWERGERPEREGQRGGEGTCLLNGS